MEGHMPENNQNKNKKRSVLIVLALLMIFFGALYTGWQLYQQYRAGQEQPTFTVTETSEQSTTGESTVENPVDFKSLKKQNEEIYAWLKVPGTKVDYPIVQSAVDDDFYLKHSAYDKSWVASGAVYTELSNTQTFKDRVTLIYGHNGYGDTMFTTLHKFEDGEFFKKHEYFYIYTPERKLTYKIVSAFKYDDRHIMNSFDFLDNAVFRSFLDMIRNPVTTNKNVAENINREYDLNDRVVVLSTCFTNQPNSRYLVCGVLEKDEKTD